MPSSTSTPKSSPTTPPDHGRISPLEQTYGQFFERTIAAAEKSLIGAGGLMKNLNDIHQVVSGLGVVLRIVTGNSVLADNYIEDHLDCPAPLSKTAEGMLTAMAAVMCERIRDDIETQADILNDGSVA